MIKKKKLYLQQKKRFRKAIQGTSLKPRLSIFRSHKHIYAQLIDDKIGHTLSFSSTLSKDISAKGSKKEVSYKVGENLAEMAKTKNISYVVFDRGSRPYIGRIAALAEGARKGGLQF